VLLCVVQFLSYAQHFVLQPTLPIYVTHLGATPFVVGLVMASFAATSMLLRPLVGYWSDRWSESGVMISGLLIQGASVLLCYLPFVGTTMIANCCRGVGWASVNSGGYALLAKAAPAARRGEASGYYSGAQGSATILLPALALWLIDAPFGGFSIVFVVAIALAACGAATSGVMARYAPPPAHERHAAMSASWWREILNVLDREIILASLLSFGAHVTFPAMASFMVLYAREISITNIAWFYVASGTTSILARPLLGKVSDNIGRRRSLLACFILQTSALALMTVAAKLFIIIISGVLYMLGMALGSATTLALAVEQAKPERRGRAMATFSVALPLSNGVGALICGSLVEWGGFFSMYLVASAIAAGGLMITVANRMRLK
jgi:MFS family permease